MRDLAESLQNDYGPGYGLTNLKLFRKFYFEYPELTGPAKGLTMRDLLESKSAGGQIKKGHTARGFLTGASQNEHSAGAGSDEISDAVSRKSTASPAAVNLYALNMGSWEPGQLHPNLSCVLNNIRLTRQL